MSKVKICLAIMMTMALAQADVSIDQIGSASLDDASIIRIPNIIIESMDSSFNFRTAYDVGENFTLDLKNLTATANISLFSLHFRQNPAQLFRSDLINPDQSGSASYKSGRLPRGGYMLLAKESNQSYRVQLPILVQDELLMDAPENLTAGQVLAVNLGRAGNLSSHAVGCLFMPLQDYDQINVTLGQNLSINIGNLSASLGRISTEELMKVLAIFPGSCTIAMEEQADSQTTLSLITEEDWVKGEYMLLGASYTPQGMSLAQKIVKVVD
jgi:hypothetical protein